MTAIFSAIDKLLTLLMGFMRKAEQASAQNERSKIEDDPTDWFVHHFDGVRDRSVDESSTDKASPKR